MGNFLRKSKPKAIITRTTATSDPDRFATVVIMGNVGVGKTSFILRETENCFAEVTTSFDSENKGQREKIFNVDATNVKLKFVDYNPDSGWAGSNSPIRSASVIIYMYDINNRETFDEVKNWKIEAGRYGPKNPIEYLVGSKIDIGKRVVTADQGKKVAAELCATFKEVSAKTGENVDKVVGELIKLILARPPPV